jgi:drug/metabolite transporter (DMT)-like permease
VNPFAPPDPGASPVITETPEMRSNLGALAVVVVAVVLQVAGAIALKTIADRQGSWDVIVLGFGLAVVGVINIARLIVWGYAHRTYPLSTTFPLSSLFFPAMLGVAAIYGDAVGPLQLAGAVLITSGVAWLTAKAPT